MGRIEGIRRDFLRDREDGEQLRIPIRSSSEWVVTGNWGKWCEIRQESGEKVDTLVLDVGVNIASAGTGDVAGIE